MCIRAAFVNQPPAAHIKHKVQSTKHSTPKSSRDLPPEVTSRPSRPPRALFILPALTFYVLAPRRRARGQEDAKFWAEPAITHRLEAFLTPGQTQTRTEALTSIVIRTRRGKLSHRRTKPSASDAAIRGRRQASRYQMKRNTEARRGGVANAREWGMIVQIPGRQRLRLACTAPPHIASQHQSKPLFPSKQASTTPSHTEHDVWAAPPQPRDGICGERRDPTTFPFSANFTRREWVRLRGDPSQTYAPLICPAVNDPSIKHLCTRMGESVRTGPQRVAGRAQRKRDRGGRSYQ
ncbi:hypothetical protein C8Q79DRAFT_763830 [Trametes meyenii]|nr:hypothetical protein C8Q79DRAFT_763830 [Trametes meyenii]